MISIQILVIRSCPITAYYNITQSFIDALLSLSFWQSHRGFADNLTATARNSSSCYSKSFLSSYIWNISPCIFPWLFFSAVQKTSSKLVGLDLGLELVSKYFLHLIRAYSHFESENIYWANIKYTFKMVTTFKKITGWSSPKTCYPLKLYFLCKQLPHCSFNCCKNGRG